MVTALKDANKIGSFSIKDHPQINGIQLLSDDSSSLQVSFTVADSPERKQDRIRKAAEQTRLGESAKIRTSIYDSVYDPALAAIGKAGIPTEPTLSDTDQINTRITLKNPKELGKALDALGIEGDAARDILKEAAAVNKAMAVKTGLVTQLQETMTLLGFGSNAITANMDQANALSLRTDFTALVTRARSL